MGGVFRAVCAAKLKIWDEAVTTRDDPRFRHQGRQPGDEIQWLEDDVCRAVAVRCLQLVTDVPIGRQRQALFRDGRPTDVAAEPFELLALIRTGRHARVQGESGHLADVVLVIGRQRL